MTKPFTAVLKIFSDDNLPLVSFDVIPIESILTSEIIHSGAPRYFKVFDQNNQCIESGTVGKDGDIKIDENYIEKNQPATLTVTYDTIGVSFRKKI